MALKVRSTKTLGKDARLKVLAYGESGVGKTVFASSFPRPFFMAAEEGLLSIAHLDVDYAEVKQWADVEDIYLHLLKEESRKRYDTVVVDSLTDLQQKAMAHILDKNNRNFAEMRDWGMLLDLMRRFLRQMGDLPYNIVFTSLETRDKDELTGIIHTKPYIQGRISDEAPAYVDIVMHLIVEDKKEGGELVRQRFGVFQPNSSALAKDRSGKLPVAMKNPTADKVIAKIKGDEAGTGKKVVKAKTTRRKR